MAQHVKILGILHIVFSALGLAAGLIVLLIFGGLAGLVSATGQSPDSALAVPILGGIGGLLFLFVLVISLPGLIGGIGLLGFKPWARILMIVISGMDLLGFPFHTALGIYGLWVLLNRETEQLFVAQAFQPVVPPRPPVS
jgi:hypothetical protein